MNCGSEDIPIMLDSLQELFQECEDIVTPKRLMRRMEQKLRKRTNLYTIAYIYTTLGFVTRRGTRGTQSYYIIPDTELLAEKRSQFCKVEGVTSHQNKPF